MIHTSKGIFHVQPEILTASEDIYISTEIEDVAVMWESDFMITWSTNEFGKYWNIIGGCCVSKINYKSPIKREFCYIYIPKGTRYINGKDWIIADKMVKKNV